MTPFMFLIGDVVRLKVSDLQVQSRLGWNEKMAMHNEHRGMVVERIIQECSGGQQAQYDVRWTQSSGAIVRELIRHHEIELVLSEPFPSNEQTETRKEL